MSLRHGFDAERHIIFGAGLVPFAAVLPMTGAAWATAIFGAFINNNRIHIYQNSTDH